MSNEPHPPPHDFQAEAAVIGVMMHSPPHVPRLVSMLKREDFYSGAYGWVFEACADLHRAGSTVDVVTVMNWLKDRDRMRQISHATFMDAITGAPSISGGIRYASIVKAKARVRATLSAAAQIIEEGNHGGRPDDVFLARSASAILDATRLPQAEALKSNAETLTSIVRNMERANAIGSMVTGLPTKIDRYDRMTLGLHGKQLTVIAARPGKGKTALGTAVAVNVAKQGVGALFFSLEMTREELLLRQIAMETGIDSNLLKMGRLQPAQWNAVHEATARIEKRPCWIDDRTSLTVRDIANVAMGAIDEAKAQSMALGLIVVDYLQKVRVSEESRRKQRYEQVGEIAIGLKQLARDTGMPVVALAQLKRLGKIEGNKKPTIEDLRESGDIENEADNVVLIHDPDPNVRTPVRMRELLIEKARGGSTGIVRVRWTPHATLFSNIPDGEGPVEDDEQPHAINCKCDECRSANAPEPLAGYGT